MSEQKQNISVQKVHKEGKREREKWWILQNGSFCATEMFVVLHFKWIICTQTVNGIWSNHCKIVLYRARTYFHKIHSNAKILVNNNAKTRWINPLRNAKPNQRYMWPTNDWKSAAYFIHAHFLQESLNFNIGQIVSASFTSKLANWQQTFASACKLPNKNERFILNSTISTKSLYARR